MHIYGYGQLENVKIENLQDVQIFYGENEAGKSTIMAFIHGILFGFPTKQQSELRYEPKHNTKYGGKIRIFLENHGYVIIERVKGKAAAGDVVVRLDDGTSGGEELLKQLLLNIDKGLFQSIFSFNLQGLQNIHQMKKDDIGKFLFSAGTLGSEHLSITEMELQKELDTRFKPGGKKPSLNEKLFTLHQFNDELKKAVGKNQEYEQLIEEKEAIQKELTQNQESLNYFQERINKLGEWKKIHPLVMEAKWVCDEMNTLEKIHFPVKGIERFEKLNQLIQPYMAQISSLKERMIKIKNELETLQPNKEILENESDILTTLDKLPLYDQLDFQQKQGKSKLLEYEEKLHIIREKLHLSLSENEVLSINTNMYMKDQVEELSRQGKELKETKQQLDHRFNEEKKALEDLKDRVRNAKAHVIPESERLEFEQQVNRSSDRKNVEIELKAVQGKIEFYKNADEQVRLHAEMLKKQKFTQFFIFGVVFIGLILLGLVTEQSILVMTGGLCIVLLGIFIFKSLTKSKMKKTNPALVALIKEEQRLVHELESPEFLKVSALQEKLALDQRFREELQIQTITLQQQHHQYEKVISKFEQWEWENAKYKEKLLEIGSQLKIPETIAVSYLGESFQLIDQFKIMAREKRQLLESLAALKREQGEIEDQLRMLANRYLSDETFDLKTSAYKLRNILKDHHEKLIKWKEKNTKLLEMGEDLEQLNQEHQHIERGANQLLSEANAESENEFYILGEKAERHAKLVERQKDLQKQLQYSSINELEWDSYLQIPDYDERISTYKQEIISLQSQQSRLQEHYASLKHGIQLLEEGGLYSELLHQFKQKKYELEVEAMDWAVFRLAQDILAQTIEKYKNIHLPRMLSKAEEFLSFLTDGNYQKILLQKSGSGFLIERRDHTIFEANELSQATTEQVYVSIRLALALTLFEKYHFPIIIDDSFVNFDARRTQKVIELLKKLDQNQILFFTCHMHLLEYFQQDNIIYLNKGAVQTIS
jgi:uncharacterized protein YhaN